MALVLIFRFPAQTLVILSDAEALLASQSLWGTCPFTLTHRHPCTAHNGVISRSGYMIDSQPPPGDAISN